jgi:hypothetical protein
MTRAGSRLTLKVQRELGEAVRVCRKQLAHLHAVAHKFRLVRLEVLEGGRIDQLG